MEKELTRSYQYYLVSPSDKNMNIELDQIFTRLKSNSEEIGVWGVIDRGSREWLCFIVRYAPDKLWTVGISPDTTPKEKEDIRRGIKLAANVVEGRWPLKLSSDAREHLPGQERLRFGAGFSNLTPLKYKGQLPPEDD